MPLTTILPTTTNSGTTPIVSPWFDVLSSNAGLGLQLCAGGTLAGSWKIEAACEPGVPAKPADITSGFSPGIVGVVSGAASAVQFAQCALLNAGKVRATFTPTSGAGTVEVHVRS